MKAAYIDAHGPISQIKVGDLPEPKPKDNEVILEVRSAALNHLDLWVCKGRPQIQLEFPHILGSDAAGVIIAKGESAHGFDIGDEVLLNPGLSCGCCEFCLKGQHSQCINYGIIGLSKQGTFAQKIAVPFYCLRHKPRFLTFEEAAALPLTFLTAWRMIYTRGQLAPGKSVLIHGIGGGVALAALKLAKLTSAQILVTSSSDEKLQKARDLGADHCINYTKTDDLSKPVLDITKQRGIDLIIDSVGAATWNSNLNIVRKGGTIVSCGVTTGAEAQTNIQVLYWKQVNIKGSTMGSCEDFRRMLNAVEQNNLKPVIDSICSLDDINEAMGKMQNHEQFGKIVVNIEEK